MYFLADSICTTDNLDPLWNVLGFLIKTIWFGVPIVLIVLGMIDLGKAVIASKEDEVKKATKAFGKRFLYAVGVFLVVWIVTVVLNLVANLGGNITNATDENGNYILDENGDPVKVTTGWKQCWDRIMK